MIKIKSVLVLLTMSFITLAFSGCTVVTSTSQTASNNTGGIFVSNDKGDTWKSKSSIPTVSGTAKSFAGLDVLSLAIDPSDSKAIYFGSAGSGLLFSYNGSETWQVASGLGNNSIKAIAIDPVDKCNIYLAIANKVMQSSDCNRTWAQIYVDDPTVSVDSIAIDHYNSSVIYISVSRGDLIKSEDKGDGWQTIFRSKDKIRKIAIDPNDSRKLYLATEKKGAFFTRDGGQNWSDLNKILSENKLGQDVRDISLVKSEQDTVLIATTYGILRSKNGGDTWDNIELIPPENKASINAMAVNLNNSQEIYYVTNTTFYRSIDGGTSWKPLKLPTDRAGAKLLVDPQNANVIYLAVKTITK